MLTILVDMDGVIANFNKAVLDVWNKENPERQLTIPNKFYWEEAYPDIPEAEFDKIFSKPGFYRDLEPIEGALEAINQMFDCGLEVFICTAPYRAISWSEKAEWVEFHLGKEWLRRLIMTKDKTLIFGTYLIDDKPEIKGLFTPMWEQVVFDAPYNREGAKMVSSFRLTDWALWPTILTHNANRHKRR